MGESPYSRGHGETDEGKCDDIGPWLQEKGVRLTKIQAIHRDEASERSVQLVEQNRQEKERAAEGEEKGPAAKPSGI
eukprot:9285201-Pyramimonas_sp.AAC.1